MIFVPDRETELRVVRGTTVTLEIELTAEDGQPYVLMEGDVIRFGVKSGEKATTYRIIKETDILESGIGRFQLEPEDTIEMEPGLYAYDIGLQSGEHYFTVVGYSDFVLLPNVTGKE